ncbi:MAG: serine/threonine protein kinase [Thermoguttaceae bacterium]
MSSNLSNKEFGDFLLLRRIGGGATADVYLAEQRSLGRFVALKILKQELSNEETFLRRFQQEARAIAKVIHPNLVQVIQVDRIDDHWFIAQEYVPGQTLQQLIHKDGALPAQQVAEVLWGCAAALEKASSVGIIHRDVKPDNILISDSGEVKLTDFGLARMLPTGQGQDETESLRITQVGMTLGTPLYMSPEQTQGKPVDHRSDIYSLGITCYHALTGQPPFCGQTALAVALQHINETPKRLEQSGLKISKEFAAVIHRMIEKTPDSRFQSFHELLVTLHPIYAQFFAGLESNKRMIDLHQFYSDKSRYLLKNHADRLRTLLSEEKKLRQTRISWPIVLIVFLVTFLSFGVGFWHVSTQPNLLHIPTNTMTKRETVAEQWVYACLLDDVDAWQSVIDFFPDEEYFWGRKAKRQQIRCFFQSGNTIDSLSIFQEFADYGDWEPDDQALGLAGLAWCAASNLDQTAASEYLRRLYDIQFATSDLLILQILDAARNALPQKHSAK